MCVGLAWVRRDGPGWLAELRSGGRGVYIGELPLLIIEVLSRIGIEIEIGKKFCGRRLCIN
jgi:hypothetical protein